ncbi:MAG: 23S rRNA (guanosine(2251)-2'-O)-methyltransferase RlmB [Acidaminococcaceae bacterium]|nr:23S rRNA (guanosine(2251)-2'-O)-methyltransferase RlmB [Acidaminococcaceae bacterium]
MSDAIVGRNAVLEALKRGRSLNKLYILDGARGGSIGEITALARESRVPIEYTRLEKLDELAAGMRHQSVVALGAPIEFQSLETVLATVKAKAKVPFLLLLDELQDPQNVGALIRTANAAGVDAVLLPSRRSCPLNAVVSKISAGAVEYVPVVQIGNISQTIQELQKQGFWVIGADMAGESQYYEADLTGAIVVVVGAEGKGLGRLVKEKCDLLVRIPMLGQVASLNASVAGAILLYEVVRQRSLCKN